MNMQHLLSLCHTRTCRYYKRILYQLYDSQCGSRRTSPYRVLYTACPFWLYHEGSCTRWRRIPCYRSPSDTLQCSLHTWRCRAPGTTRPKCGHRSRSDTASSRTDGPTLSLRPSPRTAQPSTPCVTRSRGPTSLSVPRSGTVQCRIGCYPRTHGCSCPWARQSGVAGCRTAC